MHRFPELPRPPALPCDSPQGPVSWPVCVHSPTSQGQGLCLVHPYICSRTLRAFPKRTGQGLGAPAASSRGCQQWPRQNHEKMALISQRHSSANIINSRWAQTRRKTKTEQSYRSSYCARAPGRETCVRFREDRLQKIHFAYEAAPMYLRNRQRKSDSPQIRVTWIST